MLAAIEHGPVFGDRGNDVIAFLAVPRGHTLDREIVALSSSGSKNNLSCSRPNQIRNSLTGCLYSLLTGPSEGMIATGSVAEVIGEVRQHLLEYARIDGRGGVIVHINAKFDPARPFPHFKPCGLSTRVHQYVPAVIPGL